MLTGLRVQVNGPHTSACGPEWSVGAGDWPVGPAGQAGPASQQARLGLGLLDLAQRGSAVGHVRPKMAGPEMGRGLGNWQLSRGSQVSAREGESRGPGSWWTVIGVHVNRVYGIWCGGLAIRCGCGCVAKSSVAPRGVLGRDHQAFGGMPQRGRRRPRW